MKFPVSLIALSIAITPSISASAHARSITYLLVPVTPALAQGDIGVEHAPNALALYTYSCSLKAASGGRRVIDTNFDGAAFGTLIDIGQGGLQAGNAPATVYVMGDGLRHGVRLTGFTLLDGGQTCKETVMGVEYTFQKYQAAICSDCSQVMDRGQFPAKGQEAATKK